MMSLNQTDEPNSDDDFIESASEDDGAAPPGWAMSHGHRIKWVRKRRNKIPGQKVLVVDSFLFHRLRKVDEETGEQKWKCAVETCTVKAVTVNEYLKDGVTNSHNHARGDITIRKCRGLSKNSVPNIVIKKEPPADPIDIGVIEERVPPVIPGVPRSSSPNKKQGKSLSKASQKSATVSQKSVDSAKKPKEYTNGKKDSKKNKKNAHKVVATASSSEEESDSEEDEDEPRPSTSSSHKTTIVAPNVENLSRPGPASFKQELVLKEQRLREAEMEIRKLKRKLKETKEERDNLNEQNDALTVILKGKLLKPKKSKKTKI